MGRRQKNPLRSLTEEEQTVLEQVSRGQRELASHVARAKALLAVARGRPLRRRPRLRDAGRVMR
jgi:hypothetical protein